MYCLWGTKLSSGKSELQIRVLPISEKHYETHYFEVAKALVNLGNANGV
jgi:hypothetical protein